MPPRQRGRGKGPMRGGPLQLQPSHSHNSDHPQHSSESYSSQHLRRSVSHHSHSHHSHHDSFDPNQYINSPPASQNQQNDDSDPEMPPFGTNFHHIELSSDTTSYAGSPYQGPDEWDQYFNQFTLYNTPEHNPHTPSYPPPQTTSPPQEDEPVEPVEQQQPPPQPRKPRTRARIFKMTEKGNNDAVPTDTEQMKEVIGEEVGKAIENSLSGFIDKIQSTMLSLVKEWVKRLEDNVNLVKEKSEERKGCSYKEYGM
ncbi:pyrroline-5-carboxylate reductase 1-like [Helianthus annuus]|uniref:pyrroline-5-carboxylate reductase 1-like n=1 Tax=Helianthus annuus TaxID=4232 RepID=UPI000B8F26A3|nr:pyrroline-5-carboxylate reductase 1-like [Helianthus annuus]